MTGKKIIKKATLTTLRGATFIDLFSGCGGLSLGLVMAGLEGRFAIERDSMAFETFKENFLNGHRLPVQPFTWPYWLKKKNWSVDDLLKEHLRELRALAGEVEVLAGGPPCQGFSFAGKRNESDPRNQLFQKYVDVVNAVQPKALILENVPGMKVAHAPKGEGQPLCRDAPESYYEKLKAQLEGIGYDVTGKLVDASRFGVPQKRVRLIVIGLRRDVSKRLVGGAERVFDILESSRLGVLKDLGLPETVSAREAIHDLRALIKPKQNCRDPESPPGFVEAIYEGPSKDSPYQRLMHGECRNDEMDSMRLAKHSEPVRDRFQLILSECPKGVRMDEAFREKYGLKKHRIYPMAPNVPAPTLTTLPDDVLHYEEPRILTVRESARIQSFPDWFRFKGKFTTGGAQRIKECPRYTQVGNAVPPLLGRALGLAVVQAILESDTSIEGSDPLVEPDKALTAA